MSFWSLTAVPGWEAADLSKPRHEFAFMPKILSGLGIHFVFIVLVSHFGLSQVYLEKIFFFFFFLIAPSM